MRKSMHKLSAPRHQVDRNLTSIHVIRLLTVWWTLLACGVAVPSSLAAQPSETDAADRESAGSTQSHPPDKKGWRPLFDGETFAGWEGNLKMFRIENGAIVAGHLDRPIPRNEFLCTKANFSDFELRLKVRVKGKGANAGIQFRTRRIPDHHEVVGYQADVGQGWWGKLYDESRRRRVLAEPPDEFDMRQVVRPGDWNDYRIRCEGNHIQLWLNGRQTVDYRETDDVAGSGVIAVQIHSGPPSEAWYKDLQIREIE